MKFQHFKFFFLFFSIILFLPLSIVLASSEIGISVDPQLFELDVFPGETISKKIRVGNLSERPLPISLRVVDFSAQDDSGDTVFDESSQDPSVVSWKWFEIDNPNFVLGAKESREINFVINVPQEAELRGYYSMLMIEPRLPSFYFQGSEGLSESNESYLSPKAVPVVGVLFLFSVKSFFLDGGSSEKIEVVDFSLPKENRILVLEKIISKMAASVALASDFSITEKAPSSFILRIKNSGNYHTRPSGKVLVYNIFGRKVGEAKIEQKTILPGKTRLFPISIFLLEENKTNSLSASIYNFFADNLFFGKYKAVLDLETKGPLTGQIFKPKISNRDLVFFALPWRFWLSVFLLMFLIFWFFLRKKERIFKAAIVLFKKQSS